MYISDKECLQLFPGAMSGDYVNTTGNTRKVDGRTWHQIDYPANGWIVGSVLGWE